MQILYFVLFQALSWDLWTVRELFCSAYVSGYWIKWYADQ